LVLVPLGLIDVASLPVAGVETARKALDPKLPFNKLMRRQRSEGFALQSDRTPVESETLVACARK